MNLLWIQLVLHLECMRNIGNVNSQLYISLNDGVEIVFLRSHAVHVHDTFTIYSIKLVPILLN